MKITKLGFLFCAFLFVGQASSDAAVTTSFASLLREQGLSFPDAESFKVVQSSFRKGEERTFATLIAEKGGTRIDLESQAPIQEKEAKGISDSEYAVIQSLYGARQTPYAGEVSEVIACAKEDKPRTVQESFLGKKEKVLLVNAGARFTYGVCAKDLISYRSGFLTALRKDKFLELRIFLPATAGHEKAEFQEVLTKIKSFKAIN